QYLLSFLFSTRPSLLSFLLFSLPPTPLSPTLFPYTTLFRSLPPASPGAIRHPLSACSAPVICPASSTPAGSVAGSGQRTGRAYQDRKSTRLNSSHVSISYAVFCLKKKKKTKKNMHLKKINYT